MSTYEYVDTDGFTLDIWPASGDGVWVKTSDWGAIHLPPAERAKAAQALAGDDWHVVPKWTERENDRLERENVELRERLHGTDRGEAIDPADVEVGMVVEVTNRHERVRIAVEGEVYKLGSDPSHPFHLIGYGSPEVSEKTTVRLVSRPEPDPSEQEREALRDAYDAAVAYVTGDHGGPDSGGSIRDALIPELHARNVRVVKDSEQL